MKTVLLYLSRDNNAESLVAYEGSTLYVSRALASRMTSIPATQVRVLEGHPFVSFGWLQETCPHHQTILDILQLQAVEARDALTTDA